MGKYENVCLPHMVSPDSYEGTTGNYVNTMDPVNPDTVAAVTKLRPIATAIVDALLIVSAPSLSYQIYKLLKGTSGRF